MFKLLILAHSQYQLDNTIKMSNYFTKRTKCGSEYAETMEEEPHYTKAYSVPIKPKDDPDAPPDLELEKGVANLMEEETLGKAQSDDISIQEGVIPRRGRTSSEDSQYTILGFIQRKLKNRKISQQISMKSKFSNFD